MKNEPIVAQINELCIEINKNSLLKEANDAALFISLVLRDEPAGDQDKKNYHNISGSPEAVIEATYRCMCSSTILYDILKAAITLYETPKV